MDSMDHDIAIVGPIPKDHIFTHQGEVIEKYGCVTHPAIALAKLLEGKGMVYPVSHIRKKDRPFVEDLFAPYENINCKFIGSDRDKGDEIRLEFIDQNTRIEKQTDFMAPILPDDVRDLLHCDVFIVIPISDYEVPLETLSYIRNNSDAVIIFDGHGPTHGVTDEGDRFIQLWKDRDQWLPHIDVLKMNLIESKCAWFEHFSEDRDELNPENEGMDHLMPFARHVLSKGTKALVVTLDERGSALFYLKDGQVNEEHIPAMPIVEVVDTTGCGDSFAGGLGYGLLLNEGDYTSAVQYANVLGALRATGKSFDVFKSAEETEKLVRDIYPVEAKNF